MKPLPPLFLSERTPSQRHQADILRRRVQRREDAFQDHLRREGRGTVNENPDGCYYCGSASHHSDGCMERTEDEC